MHDSVLLLCKNTASGKRAAQIGKLKGNKVCFFDEADDDMFYVWTNEGKSVREYHLLADGGTGKVTLKDAADFDDD